MTVSLISTLLTLGIAGLQATGSVSNVDVASNNATGTVIFRVTGTNPCGALHFIYGDGKAITHPISELPATITYSYGASGDYTVVVQGMGNCRGEVSTRLRATVPVAAPAPQPAPAAPPARGRGRGRAAAGGADRNETAGIRFSDMDGDRDRVITRNEWRGNDTSFRLHDWNDDGVLSGIEVQTEAARRRTFEDLDRDANGQVTEAEWRYGTDTFRRLDRNRDRIVTVTEFAATDVGDVHADRFDELDVNDDGYLSGTEWRGDAEAFNWLDIDNDRRLSRTEVLGDNAPRPGARTDAAGSVRLDLRVPANTTWRDTGLMVRAGEEVIIRASGEIQWTARSADRANAGGSLAGGRTPGAPLPGLPAGALIARVGQSEPFLATVRGGRIRMPQSGRLFLGINDDNVADNSGEFQVTIELLR